MGMQGQPNPYQSGIMAPAIPSAHPLAVASSGLSVPTVPTAPTPVVSPIGAPQPRTPGTDQRPGPSVRRERYDGENEIEYLRLQRVADWDRAEHDRRHDLQKDLDRQAIELDDIRQQTSRDLHIALDFGDQTTADRLDQLRRRQLGQVTDLEGRAANARRDPVGVITVPEELHPRLNQDYAETVAGGIDIDGRSALTGTGHPPPVEDSRGYGERFGHRQPLRWDQALLERLVPRDSSGRPIRFASVFGEWFNRLNDSGPSADPTRGINCVDCVMSFIDTWFHGRPRVSAPRTFDAYLDGQVTQPRYGELGGMRRISDALGTPFVTTYSESFHRGTPAETLHERFRELERSLLHGGPGSVAVLAHEYRSGGSHTWLAINEDGRVLYVDPQQEIVSTTPPYNAQGPKDGITRLDVAGINPDGHRLHLIPDTSQTPWEAGDPTGHPSLPPGAEIPGSDYQAHGRGSSLPDVSRAELARAVIEVRAQLPKLWVRVADGTHVEFVKAYQTEGFITARVEVGLVASGLMTQAHMDPETGEHVITVAPRIAPQVVVRAVVDAAAELVGPDMPTVRSNPGLLTQLDVLASERAWTSHDLTTERRKPSPDPAAVARLEAHLSHLETEFRMVAERVGILEPQGQPDDSDTAARRLEIQPTLGDGARSWLASLAGTHARSFLPLSEEFRRPFDALDYVAYYMDHNAPPAVRLAFEQEFLRPPLDLATGRPVRSPLADYLKDTIDTFNKQIYKTFFPSTSKERPLTPDETATATAMVRPLVDEAEHRLEEMRLFCAEHLSDVPFDQVIAQGTQAWQSEFTRLKAIADDIISGTDYKGAALGYIGSMVVGRRGPHKASTHTNLRSFDLDLYVTYPADFETLYDHVKAYDSRVEPGKERLSRGKIFSVEGVTIDLEKLTRQVRRRLKVAFEGNTHAAESEIVLRREPPY